MAFAKLQTLLPEKLIDLKRTGDLAGSTVPDGENTYSEAVGEYAGADEVSLRVSIQDNPSAAARDIGSKTTMFKTYPVVAEAEGGGESDFRIIVGDRFMVSAHGNKLKVAQLRSAFEALDLAKLESWKLEGLAK